MADKNKEYVPEYRKELETIEEQMAGVEFVPGINDPFLSGINVKLNAIDIPFDNSTSGLSSTNVQDAIVEAYNAIP